MQTFYSTIFVAVLGLFGLLVAALFYVAQMVHTRHSSARAQKLMHGRFSQMFWLCGVLTLAMSSIGLVTQSFAVSCRRLVQVTTSASFGSLALIALGFTFIFFVVSIRKYSHMLSPLFLAHELAKSITLDKINDLALFRLNVTVPKPPTDLDISQFLSQMDMEELLDFFPASSPLGGQDTAPPPTAELPIKAKQSAKKSVDPYQQIEDIKLKIRTEIEKGDSDDPLSDLFELTFAIVTEHNSPVWESILGQIVMLYRQVREQGYYQEKDGIPFRGDELILQHLRDVFEEIAIGERFSLCFGLIRNVVAIAADLIEHGYGNRAYQFIDFIEDIAIVSVRRDKPLVFALCLRELGKMGRSGIEERHFFDHLVRVVGRVSEKLILRGVEDEPLVPGAAEQNELEAINECFSALTDAVKRAKDQIYPVVLMDIIELVSDRMMGRIEPNRFREPLLFLMIDYVELSRHVVQTSENVNAEVILYKSLRYLKELVQKGLDGYGELESDIYSWIREFAMDTIQHNQKLVNFGTETADEIRDLSGMVIKTMLEMPNHDEWDGEMRELLIKAYDSTKEKDPMNFIHRAGKVLRRNFGLMFDWQTGKLYAKDDPRRY